MEKLNRLGWAAGISFLSYGVRVGIRTNDSAILNEIADYLPPLWKPSAALSVERLYTLIIGGSGETPNIRRFNLLYANYTQLARAKERQPVLDALETDLQLFVAEAARRRLFVHAGVVGWHGKAIVIPARSLRGKTTLVAEFVRAGATYYSDEYAVFDTRGRVHPYPRALSVREATLEKPKKYPVEALGGIAGAKPLPVGLVLVSEYKERARWHPQRLSFGQGALALMANTVAARRKPEVMLETLQQALSQASVLKGTRGEAKDVVDSVLAAFPSN